LYLQVEGKLEWQDTLNSLNHPFFDATDGLFVNYCWKASPPNSAAACPKVCSHNESRFIDASLISRTNQRSSSLVQEHTPLEVAAAAGERRADVYLGEWYYGPCMQVTARSFV